MRWCSNHSHTQITFLISNTAKSVEKIQVEGFVLSLTYFIYEWLMQVIYSMLTFFSETLNINMQANYQRIA